MKKMLAKEVQQALEQGEQYQLIDVRSEKEVETGQIPGIINIPLNSLEHRIHELDQRVPYIIICRSGAGSAQATQFLENQGFNATNMHGGMLTWEGEVSTSKKSD